MGYHSITKKIQNVEDLLVVYVMMQKTCNNRISDSCLYAQVHKVLTMHMFTYMSWYMVHFLT